ncbi:MAG: amino acid ABC transporter permease [Polaromonas sp.]|nr:amino acid ABC transporter permease [Polaromonas sp.]
MTEIFITKPGRPAPVNTEGLVPWLKANLFASIPNAILSVCILSVLAWAAFNALQWGVFNAVVAADHDLCQAARGVGACWGVVNEKARLIVLGRYPQSEHWRAELAMVLLLGLVVSSCSRYFWKVWLPLLWVVVLAAFFTLMSGGIFGLPKVTTDQWGGLPLTIMLTVISMTMAFPIAMAVALGRRSGLPAIKSVCVVYVELVRGVPLISVLFMASFMFPLFMPPGTSPDVLIRVIVGITLFAAAYMAEIIRGGLQSLSKGQTEAAASLGLGYWQTQIKIVLPQALGTVVPSIMNNFISLFKDTSLVTIVSLYELTGALGLAVGSDPNWRPFKIEAYLFIAAIYFTCCFSMSRYSLWIEKRLAVGKAR